MTPFFEAGNIQIYHGDAREVLSDLDVEATACVTDPPYGLNFMGEDWDNFRRRKNENDVSRDNVGGRLSAKAPASGAETDSLRYQLWCMEWGEIVMDALVPGAPVLAFSGTRTAHRLTCGLEDAGLVIRDRLAWMYGSGFPKSHDISKAIDDAKGADREDLGPNPNAVGRSYNKTGGNYGNDHEEDRAEQDRITAPATDEAERWDGYGTALAPAHEPITLAMKPKDGTFAENALSCGVAGLNIDAARIETNEKLSGGSRKLGDGVKYGKINKENEGDDGYDQHDKGRWPANVVLDEAAAELVDQQSGADCGQSGAVTGSEPSFDQDTRLYGNYSGQSKVAYPKDDGGGASRFFYTAKASKSDRNAGLPPGEENDHPTVKPTDLMGWLLRLVEMPQRNLILDPFCGSGTTPYVCQQMGLPCVAIDQDEESCELAAKRLSEPSLFSQD